MGSLVLCLKIFFLDSFYHLPLKHQIFPKALACFQSIILFFSFPQLFKQCNREHIKKYLNCQHPLNFYIFKMESVLSNHQIQNIEVSFASLKYQHSLKICLSQDLIQLEII